MNEIVPWLALREVISGTTLLRFLRLLEKYQLGEKHFATVGQVLPTAG